MVVTADPVSGAVHRLDAGDAVVFSGETWLDGYDSGAEPAVGIEFTAPSRARAVGGIQRRMLPRRPRPTVGRPAPIARLRGSRGKPCRTRRRSGLASGQLVVAAAGRVVLARDAPDGCRVAPARRPDDGGSASPGRQVVLCGVRSARGRMPSRGSGWRPGPATASTCRRRPASPDRARWSCSHCAVPGGRAPRCDVSPSVIGAAACTTSSPSAWLDESGSRCMITPKMHRDDV